MRLHNFFIEEKIGDQKQITIDDSDLLNQWRHVLRLNTGSSVVLLDNSGYEYLASFSDLNYRFATLHVLEKRKNKFAPKKEIFLFQSIIKPDKFEWTLEKGTELGVAHFRPVITHRSVAKKLNLVRARKIIKESAEQSGRGVLPDIAEPVSLEAALSSLPAPAIVLDPSGENFQLSISNFQSIFKIGIFIGPEGGWSDQELQLFRDKNIPLVSLGSQILRAETAAVAVSALLLL